MLIDGKKVLEIDFNSDTSRGSRFLQNFDLVEGNHRFESSSFLEKMVKGAEPLESRLIASS